LELAFPDPSNLRLVDDLRQWHTKRKRPRMRYLIDMKLSGSVRPRVPQDGIFLIERFILPSLEICRKWQAEQKLLAGGPVSGSIQLAIVLEVESVQELDELIEGLPLWPLMETTVIPLTTFEGRIQAVQSKLKQLKSLIADPVGVMEASTQR
jgi:muconolactone delta-isomerase